MKRVPTSLIAMACLALMAWIVPNKAMAAPGGRGKDDRAVCGQTHGLQVRCMVHVVTDSSGTPLTTSAPTTTSTGPFGPREFHLGYHVPCTPNGAVDGTAAQYSCNVTSWGGQIIAIVDAYNDPNIASDLAVYDKQFGIAACPQGGLKSTSACLTVVNETGGTKLPATNAGWTQEISLDVEMAHMMDQSAKILLVEAATDNLPDLSKAEQTAASLGATQISNSYGTSGENSLETSYDPYYTYTGVGVFVSSGDNGTNGSVEYPAASRDVIAVGGTQLTLNWDDSYASESVWGEYHLTSPTWEGTGSGCSLYEGAPQWQPSYIPNWFNLTGCAEYNHLTNARAVGDVAADADPIHSGAAIYDSTPVTTGTTTTSGWYTLGGTSMATPLVAAIAAMGPAWIVGQLPAQTLYINHYALVNGTAGTDSNLHDVTTGSNWDPTTGIAYPLLNGYQSIMFEGYPGYDGPTGLGTPNGVGAF